MFQCSRASQFDSDAAVEGAAAVLRLGGVEFGCGGGVLLDETGPGVECGGCGGAGPERLLGVGDVVFDAVGLDVSDDVVPVVPGCRVGGSGAELLKVVGRLVGDGVDEFVEAVADREVDDADFVEAVVVVSLARVLVVVGLFERVVDPVDCGGGLVAGAFGGESCDVVLAAMEYGSFGVKEALLALGGVVQVVAFVLEGADVGFAVGEREAVVVEAGAASVEEFEVLAERVGVDVVIDRESFASVGSERGRELCVRVGCVAVGVVGFRDRLVVGRRGRCGCRCGRVRARCSRLGGRGCRWRGRGSDRR